MNNQKKALLVALAVAGVSISGPMVKWSLSCGASPVMVAFGRMAISFLLLLVPALRSGENREKYFDRIKAIYDRYFVPSDEAAAFVDARFRELIAPGERTLGLLCRGTDYFTKRPYKHQIQPTVAQIIEKTDETLAAHPVDKIFVATEDEAILAALKAKYGGKLVYVECPRLTAVQGQSVAEGFAERGVDRKLNGLYYFASIAILARCDHLIAGKTMATQFIRTMRDTPFETEFYWDLGRYGVDDVGKRGISY